MKITDIKATTVDVKLDKVFRGSNYQIDHRTTIIVNIETDEGITSEVYCGDERKAYRELHQLVVGPLRNILVGKDSLAVERLWGDMFALTPALGNKAVAMRAIAAIDIALWDILGKALRVPVSTLLGGFRKELPVILFTYYVQGKDTKLMVDDLLEARERGISGAKLKVGGVPISEDILRVEAIRKAFGSDFIIVCDANQAWTLDEAEEFCQEAEELNLAWLEEPIRWYDASEGMRRLKEKTRIPIAAGQGESTRFGAWKLVEDEAVDILNADASIVGGITEWRRIAGAASIKGIRMAHHEEPHIAVQILSAIPHGLYVEVFEKARDPVYYHLNQSLPKIGNGLIQVPDAPGLGLELDKDYIARHRVI